MTVPITAKKISHVIIAMVGSSLCVNRRRLLRIACHERGASVLNHRVNTDYARVAAATKVSAFTSGNWSLIPAEMPELTESLVISSVSRMKSVKGLCVKLHIVSDRGRPSISIQDLPAEAEQSTLSNQFRLLNGYINTSERRNIAAFVQAVASRVEVFTELSSNRDMAMSYVGDPELWVKTGGKHCFSIFFLRQAAYTELYLSSSLWSDFNAADLDEALVVIQKRECRFGQAEAYSDNGMKVS